MHPRFKIKYKPNRGQGLSLHKIGAKPGCLIILTLQWFCLLEEALETYILT